MIDPDAPIEHSFFELVDTTPRAEFERVPVPEHTTHRMTVHNPLYPMDPPWVFTYAKTGCLRVQRGDFCAYVPAEVLGQLGQFLAMRPDA